MITFQEILRRLSKYWEDQGCIVHQGYDLEVGAGTMNPATFLRCLGPEPYRAAYVEPCRRPADGRYGTNPNRMQHYFQYQVILKPSPLNMQQIYIDSLTAIGIDLSKHDLRFVHDDWENPTIGAYGLGWEVWLDGMEVTQYTYFQGVANQELSPITGELTYGIERLAMYIQGVDSIFDLKWNDHLTYGDIYQNNEVEWSHYNFEQASTDMWFSHFNDFEKESKKLIEKKLPIPAYEFVMKASHAFNILDARGVISVTERTSYISRIRELAREIAQGYVASREKSEFPLLKVFPVDHPESPECDPIPTPLLSAGAEDTSDFLLEIGSEQLPATFVPIGMRNLESAVTQLLSKEGIKHGSVSTYGTPRRLSILIKDLALAIPEQKIERKGPALDKAYDANENITRAGEGFFRSLGIEPPKKQNAEVRQLKGVDYLFATAITERKATAEILVENLSKLILGLDFPKKMRWSNIDISYARPLKWVVCLMGSTTLPFTVGNIASGKSSYGHTQLAPALFEIKGASEYLETLRKHYVMADPAERKESINGQLEHLEKSIDAQVIEREAVMRQVINLVEWPQVTSATYDSSFLSIPKEVLISEMVEHQKYFPIEKDGKLINQFVITADTEPTDHIRKGNQKVLSSRLSDGAFLYKKGLDQPLESFNKKLESVTYLAGFGTMHDKVLRLVGHADTIQKTLKISKHDLVDRAARLSKADLATEMVFEFPELQGVIGKYYALAQNEKEEVAYAIEEQWMPLGESTPLPSTETGMILSLSDKFDNLISCFNAGLKPTSSSDPYALRRQALGIIKILIAGKYRLPLKTTLEKCGRNFIPSRLKNLAESLKEIEAFFVNRIKTVFTIYGFEKDEVEASVSYGFSDIYDTFCRVQALHNFRKTSSEFPSLCEVYKRAKGQTNNREAESFSEDFLQETAEKELYTLLNDTEEEFNKALAAYDYDKTYALIAKIRPALAKLFDKVKILADDTKLKSNRIALLQRVLALFAKVIDFEKIVG